MSIHPAIINFFFYFGQDDKEKEVIFPIICVDQFYLRL